MYGRSNADTVCNCTVCRVWAGSHAPTPMPTVGGLRAQDIIFTRIPEVPDTEPEIPACCRDDDGSVGNFSAIATVGGADGRRGEIRSRCQMQHFLHFPSFRWVLGVRERVCPPDGWASTKHGLLVYNSVCILLVCTTCLCSCVRVRACLSIRNNARNHVASFLCLYLLRCH